MTPRLASLYDQQAISEESEPRPSSTEAVARDVNNRLGIPGRFLVGDLIRARACPSIQGVVLGKTRGREAVRVLLAPYASGSVPVASVIIDIPAAIIPVQGCLVTFSFWNPVAVQNYVHYLAKKGPIKREQENQLLSWVNSKQYPEESIFSATSELSIPRIASPGLVKSRVREHEQATQLQSSSVAPAEAEVIVVSDAIAEESEKTQLVENCAMPETRARSSDAKERRDNSISSPPSETAASRVNLGSPGRMAPTQTTENLLQSQFQQFSLEVKQQFEELTKLVTGVARRQKVVEEKLSESTSSNAAQWEELDLRLNAATHKPQEPAEGPRPKDRQGCPPSEDGEADWLPSHNRRDEPGWQVQSKRVGRAAIDAVDEATECPFSLQSRRNDGFRVTRAHRRAHRRLLEEVYGANDSAVAAAHQLLGQLEKDTHSPVWEVAMLLQVAKGLDILLLEHEDGMWTQWNQPIVDFLARFYFEMVARVRPEEDVVQLMQPDLQKRLRELNFGKQRSYGPVAQVARQNKNWRSGSQYDKPFSKDTSSQRKNQWGNTDKTADTNNAEAAAGQGTWMWHPGVATHKVSPSFRPDPPPYPPAPAAPRPPP